MDSTPSAPWLDIARREMHQVEVPGPKANPRIIEYHATTSLKATSDEVPWCSAFVNWVMEQAGIKGTGSAAARSWLKWGVPSMAKVGAIAIFKRGDNPAAGHVGFVVGAHPGGYLEILGGNQSDQVKVSTFKVQNCLACRWPVEKEEA